jgi:hypothetical protein
LRARIRPFSTRPRSSLLYDPACYMYVIGANIHSNLLLLQTT